MTTFVTCHLHELVNNSTDISINNFFKSNSEFQKYLIHQFIDYLPKSNIKLHDIFTQFKSYLIPKTLPVYNKNNNPIVASTAQNNIQPSNTNNAHNNNNQNIENNDQSISENNIDNNQNNQIIVQASNTKIIDSTLDFESCECTISIKRTKKLYKIISQTVYVTSQVLFL